MDDTNNDNDDKDDESSLMMIMMMIMMRLSSRGEEAPTKGVFLRLHLSDAPYYILFKTHNA